MLKTKSYSSALLPPLHTRQHVSFNELPINPDLKDKETELGNQTAAAGSVSPNHILLGDKA
jgi:hypothetical protein